MALKKEGVVEFYSIYAILLLIFMSGHGGGGHGKEAGIVPVEEMMEASSGVWNFLGFLFGAWVYSVTKTDQPSGGGHH